MDRLLFESLPFFQRHCAEKKYKHGGYVNSTDETRCNVVLGRRRKDGPNEGSKRGWSESVDMPIAVCETINGLRNRRYIGPRKLPMSASCLILWSSVTRSSTYPSIIHRPLCISLASAYSELFHPRCNNTADSARANSEST